MFFICFKPATLVQLPRRTHGHQELLPQDGTWVCPTLPLSQSQKPEKGITCNHSTSGSEAGVQGLTKAGLLQTAALCPKAPGTQVWLIVSRTAAPSWARGELCC